MRLQLGRALGLAAALLAGCAGSGIDDLDGDGITDAVDCAPSDPAIFPGADEVCDNGIDDDCDGQDDALDSECWPDVGPLNSDEDRDGWSENTGDCDDGQITVHPGAEETCGDLWDNDCNGVVDDCPDEGAPAVGSFRMDATVINGTSVTLDAVSVSIWGLWDAVPEHVPQPLSIAPNGEQLVAGQDFLELSEGEGWYMLWVGYADGGCFVNGGMDIIRANPFNGGPGPFITTITLGLTPGRWRSPCVLPPEVL